MQLLDEVNNAINEAMKAQRPDRLGPLRMLKAALVNRRVEKGRELDQNEALQVVSTLVRQRRDSIEHFVKGGRQDLADKEAAEIRVLEEYLPPAADPRDIEEAVDAAVAETGASSPKDLGKVMKAAMSRLAGKGVEGRAVSDVAKRRLGG